MQELNTAEDFISFYEEIFPLIQTLPQIILHKDLIVSRLLSGLKMEGRLSLEPILRYTYDSYYSLCTELYFFSDEMRMVREASLFSLINVEHILPVSACMHLPFSAITLLNIDGLLLIILRVYG